MYILCIIYNIYVMMKPPSKASDGDINVVHAPWFDTCRCGFIKLYKHGFEVMIVMSCPLVQYQVYNHLALGLSDYKPDIALVS